MSALFRREAVQHSANRLEGEVVLAAPLALKLLALVAIVIVVCGAIFVSTATYARKETVPGWLAPERGVVRAAALRGGRVEALLAGEGETITAGAPIARLRLAAETTEGDAGQRVLDALAAQARAQAAGAEAEIERLEAEAGRLQGALSALQAEAQDAQEQIRLQAERVALAREQVERAEALAERGFLSGRELDDRRTRLLQARQDLAALERSASALARQIGDARSQLDAIPLLIAAERARAASALAAVDERTSSAEAQTRYVVTAPLDARIAAMPTRPGQNVTAGETIAVLVPDGDRLIAELYAPSRAAGFIREGQEVRLMYQAFPHQRFGAARARIVRVSRTVLAPEEAAIPGLQLAEPAFRVEAELEREHVEAYGEDIPLQPGMMLSADIVIDERTLIEWLFDPLFAAGRRG